MYWMQMQRDQVPLIWGIFTPHACARGKVIGCVIVVVVVGIKITISRDVGI